MARSRNRLHVDKLATFTEFCVGKGWECQPVKGAFEALRMTRDGKTLIVHERIATSAGGELVHLTTWGESEKMLNQWLREK